jgi:hypothetical protein
MTKETFLKEVRKEINAIKINATQEELDRLDFDEFDSSLPFACIYGLLTGNCYSERSIELFDKVFDSVYKNNLKFDANLKSNKNKSFYNFTYLEVYLVHSDSKYHKHIIDYLQSKVKRLKTLKLNN